MKRALTGLLMVCGAVAAHADPVLPATAFVKTPPCKLDPYADATLETRERRLQRDCGTDLFALRGDGRVRQRPRVEIDNNAAYRLDGLSFNFSLGWAGWRDSVLATGRTERATAAGAAMVRLGPGWALDSGIGRDLRTGQRVRSTLTNVWQPREAHVTFLQWAAEPTGLAKMVGWRWWAVPRRYAFDLTVAAPPASGPLVPRVGFSIYDL